MVSGFSSPPYPLIIMSSITYIFPPLFPRVSIFYLTHYIMASAHLFDVQIMDHIIVDMDSDAYLSFADEKIIEDTKQKVMAIINQIPNTLAKS